MKASKAVSLLASILLASTCLCALPGCGQDSEKLIRDNLTSELDGIKNLDDSALNMFTAGTNPSEEATFNQMGIDMKEYAKAFLSGFDYQINDIKVDGDKAQAEVVLTCKKFSDCESAIENSMTQLGADGSIASMGQSDIQQKIGQAVIDAVRTVPPTQTDPIEITYQLVGKTWSPTADAQANLQKAMMS